MKTNYDQSDLTKVGKHDFQIPTIADKWKFENQKTFSINIFPWGLYSNGKKLKQLKGVVRVHGNVKDLEKMTKMAELVANQLDCDEWDGRKNVFV